MPEFAKAALSAVVANEEDEGRETVKVDVEPTNSRSWRRAFYSRNWSLKLAELNGGPDELARFEAEQHHCFGHREDEDG